MPNLIFGRTIHMAHIQKDGIHRGVSTYSWYQLLDVSMTLEDCFQEMYDIGARGLEILDEGVIPGYPFPTTAWLDWWFGALERYDIAPVEYGHWVESRLYRGRELTAEESFEALSHDIKLASFMGFSCMRTKLGVCDDYLTPVKNWREIIRRALPLAEKYNIVLLPEIHMPTRLTDQMLADYCEFIDREQTRHFGLNIDFGVFQLRRYHDPSKIVEHEAPILSSRPEDIIPLLPYVHCCHAKFYNVTETFEDSTIPYPEIVRILQEQHWNGYLLSEYEGPFKDEPGHPNMQIRRQHILLKRLLGE